MQTVNQEHQVLNHLRRAGSITRVEAEALYRIRHLPTRIFNLKKSGVDILSTTKKDVTGQRYTRYTLVQ